MSTQGLGSNCQTALLYQPDESRGSHPILWELEGEIPPGYPTVADHFP